MPDDCEVAKLDFTNAINNLHRDVILQTACDKLSNFCAIEEEK